MLEGKESTLSVAVYLNQNFQIFPTLLINIKIVVTL